MSSESLPVQSPVGAFLRNLVADKEVWALISHSIFFCEHVNWFAANRYMRGQEALPMQGLLLSARHYFRRPGARWSLESPVLRAAANAGALPDPDLELIEAIIRFLVQPAEITESGPAADWGIVGNPNMIALVPPVKLYEDIWLQQSAPSVLLTTKRASGHGWNADKQVPLVFLDEVLDPFGITTSLLVYLSGVGYRARAHHQIQQWVRRSGNLRYSAASKVLLADLSRSLNQLFYDSSLPTLGRIQAERPATISTSLLQAQIEAVVTTQSAGKDAVSSAELAQRSFGLLLLLRFCKMLRVRYAWVDREHRKGSVVEEKIAGLVQTAYPLRRIEAGYLQVRAFGSLSEIEGLNFIFRGGILPHVEGGRTLVLEGPPGSGKTVLALQKLVGVAAKGGVGIYFSFEESRELIAERLITFGFLDRSRFRVEEAGADILRRIDDHYERFGNLGLLVLYGGEDEGTYPLPEVISQIGGHLARKAKWRALVIDSANALLFKPDAADFRTPQANRLQLRSLRDAIEDNGFLGIVISESTLPGVETLVYIADTVISLSFEESKRGRLLEIKKCRSQNYHGGHHPFRIMENRGVKIYPSLGAVRSAFRRKAVSTLSQDWAIPVEGTLGSDLGVWAVAEKSSLLISGPGSSGKSQAVLRLASAPLRPVKGQGEGLPPTGVLVVTFRTPVTRYRQMIQSHPEISKAWQKLRFADIRWYGPGSNITGAQIIDDLRRSLTYARQDGAPVTRIVFEEVESAGLVLPRIEQESLFWPTVLALVGVEALTAFFVYERTEVDKEAYRFLRSEVDYVVDTVGVGHCVLSKRPDTSLPYLDGAEG